MAFARRGARGLDEARALTRSAALVALVALAAACGGGGDAEGASAETSPDERAEEEGARAEETASGGAEGASAAVAAEPSAPEDACERAAGCCPAYVEAMPAASRGEAGEACATLGIAIAHLEGDAQRAACHGALEGFRRALRAHHVDAPPEACR